MKKTLTFALTALTGFSATLALAPDAHAATSIRVKALNVAAAQKNDPYRYGAAGPNAFDCSGLIYYSFKKSGKTLPRTAQSQYNKARHEDWHYRTKGDLVFIGKSSKSVTHVGIYAGYWSGKSWMWNANTGSYRGRRVVVAPINEYLGGGRKAMYGRIG